MSKSTPNKKFNRMIAVIVSVLLLLTAGCVYYIFGYADIGESGSRVVCRADATELDLTGSEVGSLRGIGECDELEKLYAAELALTDIDELMECSNLKYADLRGSKISVEKYIELKEALPECKILWDIPFTGTAYTSEAEEVDLSTVSAEDYALLAYMPNLRTVDASKLQPSAELVELYNSLPECAFNWTVELCGTAYDCNTEKLYMNDVKVKDLETFKQQLAYLPKLRKAELCRSGLSNEQMEELIAAYPSVKFVWEIQMGEWTLRTDVTNFSTANLTKIPDPTYSELEQLRYLTDIVALDLGHNNLPPLDFLSGLTTLRALILADCNVTDITPLGTLVNLEYVELFENNIRDISAVSKWPLLKEVNLATNRILDFSPLYECKMLERVWLGQNYSISNTKRAELLENLPEGVELNTYIWRWDGATERNYHNPDERGWRPIDYRKWGFTYDNPKNTTNPLTDTTHSSADIDSTPKDD